MSFSSTGSAAGCPIWARHLAAIAWMGGGPVCRLCMSPLTSCDEYISSRASIWILSICSCETATLGSVVLGGIGGFSMGPGATLFSTAIVSGFSGIGAG